MNKIRYILSMLAAALILAACTHEPAVLDINVTAENSSIKAGESVTFNITGEYDFVSFYSGMKGKEWNNYPIDKGVFIDLPADVTTYSVMYTDTDGVVVSKFIATSYGDWGKEEITKVIEIAIDVDDNRTLIQSVRIKYKDAGKSTSGKGVVDNENGTVTFDVSATADLSNVNVSISPYSSKEKVFFNNAEVTSAIDVDFSTGSPKFTILAANGETKQDFSFIFNRI